MPLVTCAMPYPQSNATRAGPTEPKGTPGAACVVTLSIQLIALSSVGGTYTSSDDVRLVRVPVSILCIAAAVPATTALRWLKTLVQEGIFVRRADPHDGRRVFVELAPEASRALRRYFAEVGAPAVI